MARRLAALMPFYEYRRGASSFAADGAPDDVAARAARRLHAARRRLYRERFRAAPLRRPRRLSTAISDLQFTDAYRVPFQFSRIVRQHLRDRRVLRVVDAAPRVTDLDGNRFYDLTGSYGVNVFGYDFYKACIARGAARVATLGPVLGAYHPVVAYNVERLREISGPRRSLVPHVGHRGGDAGGAARALSHPARRTSCASAAPIMAGGATCSRASAIRVPARETYTLRDMSETDAARAAHAARHRLRAGQSAAGAASERGRAGRFRRWSTAAARAGFDRAAYAEWLQRLRARVQPSAASC